MNFGRAVAEACASFAITNVDDMFVLITFYAEAAKSKTLTPFKIVLGQYIGFTIIIAISMIGFGVSFVLPSEPIGFFGLLPILLGIWKFCSLFLPNTDEETEITTATSMKVILKVTLITLMNGGDNIGTYVPLFSQVERAEIAIYVIIYYIMLGVWCLVAFLVMRQKHVLAFAQKYVAYALPFLYVGLGIFIVIKSDCYPWAIEKIDNSTTANPGQGVMAGVTTFVLLTAMSAMAWFTSKKRKDQPPADIDLTSREAPASTSELMGTTSDSSNIEISRV